MFVAKTKQNYDEKFNKNICVACELIWKGTNVNDPQVASGTYIYRIEAGTFTQVRKMVLIK